MKPDARPRRPKKQPACNAKPYVRPGRERKSCLWLTLGVDYFSHSFKDRQRLSVVARWVADNIKWKLAFSSKSIRLEPWLRSALGHSNHDFFQEKRNHAAVRNGPNNLKTRVSPCCSPRNRNPEPNGSCISRWQRLRPRPERGVGQVLFRAPL